MVKYVHFISYTEKMCKRYSNLLMILIKEKIIIYFKTQRHVLQTLLDKGVGLNTTFPSSLSSSARTPGFSVYNLTLTAGKGCVVLKSPCVSHLYS